LERIGEALAPDIEDLNPVEDTFRVIGKGNRERVGYLAEETSGSSVGCCASEDAPKQGRCSLPGKAA